MDNNTTQNSDKTRLLSRRELAARWSMSTQTVRQRERCGMISPLRLGGAVRYKLSDIEKLEAEAAQ
jgi:predicted DNA-binding transcriptional regulator AlpA